MVSRRVVPSVSSCAAPRDRWSSARGFSLIELLVVIALIGILGAVAIGITPGIIQSAKSEGATSQVGAFLKRNRELAVSRRRNIQITFTAPNQISATQLPVPDLPNPLPAPTLLETMYFEGRIEYRLFAGVPDTQDQFGNALAINLGGAAPVMFTSEGTFADVNGDPVNVSLFFGVANQPQTANSISILGTTAAVRTWRWDGSQWVR